jgi:protein disulfide-isomerase A1
VVIAKMDGTENEHPDVEVKGFPTIFLFPAAKGAKPIELSGDRSLKVGGLGPHAMNPGLN